MSISTYPGRETPKPPCTKCGKHGRDHTGCWPGVTDSGGRLHRHWTLVISGEWPFVHVLQRTWVRPVGAATCPICEEA